MIAEWWENFIVSYLSFLGITSFCLILLLFTFAFNVTQCPTELTTLSYLENNVISSYELQIPVKNMYVTQNKFLYV